ncbi:FlgB family protein [Nioella sediminis]|jgi:flagellar basal-body rod protein FlgB|uniref:FlgB family protein n=1 Tax=Nioella sediminis TaxID=1912092 RepID=UPI0008FD7575|nr:FlgB family protein [Nioella sediminis]TBX28465.1 flagellar basal-body rod protein FlgB [Roseovarius sp. JS7-11]
MFENLEIFGLAQARARHAAARQTQVAMNVANADTPGYRARDVVAFEEVFRTANAGQDPTRLPIRTMDAGGPESPNGNTVSLELEMVRSVQAQRDHSRALNVYRSAMNVLRTSLGR